MNGFEIEGDLLDEFKGLLEQEDFDALSYWSDKINPKVIGMEDVKRAVLLSIASHTDEHGDRGRVHVLLEGKPGTAKSTIQMWLSHKCGAEFCSHRTSEVGLTGDMRGDEITAGALPRADKNVLVIDELDKFKPKDRAGLLEAMADGIVKLEGGGMSTQFDARVRVIAGCNSTDAFSPELLDRFDFHFKLKTPEKDKTKDIMEDRVDSFFMSKNGYDGMKLRKYVEWARTYKPDISLKTREIIKKLIKMYIDFEEKPKGIRNKEAFLRVGYTIAKLHRRDMIPEDVLRAIVEIDRDTVEKYKSMSENGYVNGDLKEPIDNVLSKLE